ncbi:MAG: hypothetical protein WC215_04435 [Bacilli bacterium]
MKIFSKKAFKKGLHYDWLYYVLASFIAIGLWSWAFGVLHRPQAFERLDLFVASEIKNAGFNDILETEFENDGLKLVESNQALPNDNAFQSKLQVVGYNSSDLLILPESIFENVLFEEALLPVDGDIKESYLEGTESFYSYQDVDYGILLRGGSKTSWLDNYINFDVNDNYYLFISGSSQNISDLGNYETAEYDLALEVLSYLVR